MSLSVTDIDKLLREIYYDKKHPAGFSSQIKLYREAKKRQPKITLLQVKKWWTTQKIPTRFSKATKKFTRTTFAAPYAHHTYLSDLADFWKLARYNDGFRWLIVVQDLFSRKLIALFGQRTKTSRDTAKSLDKVFAIRAPKKFLTDKGGEFAGECKSIYKKYGIYHYTTKDVTQKVAPTERAILVIKQRLFKMMNSEKRFRWIDKLDAVVHAYNNSYNRTLDMTPLEAEKKENQAKVFHNSVTRAEVKHKLQYRDKFKYEVGQVVRILKDQTFQKSYTGNYSNMLYRIYNREFKFGVPVYYLKELLTGEEVTGGFYTDELKPVSIDESALPKVKAIHDVRLDNEQEQVLVSFQSNPKKKIWVFYDDLIPYK